MAFASDAPPITYGMVLAASLFARLNQYGMEMPVHVWLVSSKFKESAYLAILTVLTTAKLASAILDISATISTVLVVILYASPARSPALMDALHARTGPLLSKVLALLDVELARFYKVLSV
jgi:hypothetical protein